MIRQTRLHRGSNVYVPNPQRLIPDCVSITGDVVRLVKRSDKQWATMDAYVAKLGGGYPIALSLPVDDLRVRMGTPLSARSLSEGTLESTDGNGHATRVVRSPGNCTRARQAFANDQADADDWMMLADTLNDALWREMHAVFLELMK